MEKNHIFQYDFIQTIFFEFENIYSAFLSKKTLTN